MNELSNASKRHTKGQKDVQSGTAQDESVDSIAAGPIEMPVCQNTCGGYMEIERVITLRQFVESV